MPYELCFTHPVAHDPPESYINPCCIGGDVVSEQLLPVVRATWGEPDAGPEDWGWFLWFKEGKVRLAIDIVCDDPDRGAFRIHLTSSRRGLLWSDKVVDTPELERLRDIVVQALTSWTGGPVTVSRLDADHNPVDPA